MHIVPFDQFACPLDGLPLTLIENQFKCSQNHCFDIAKQRYSNLLAIQDKRSRFPGDSKEMVVARQFFLDSGAYLPVAEMLNDIVLELSQSSTSDCFRVLDAGCGEGYYLAQLQQSALAHDHQKAMSLLGIDIAKPAILAATQRERHKISWAVASNRKIPVLPDSLDIVLCMFGFPVFEAFKTALNSSGCLLLVESGPQHLIEIRERVYEQVKYRSLPEHQEALSLGFSLCRFEHVSYQQLLARKELQNLLLMTPHFFKVKPQRRQLIEELQELNVTVDVRFRLYRVAK